MAPYVGGGIAPIVTAAATLLSDVAEVTVVTTDRHRDAHERLRAEADPRLVPDSVRLVWAPEPEEGRIGAFFSHMHAYSARVDRALREAYPDGGPEVIEFCDYLGEGFVTVQARRTLDPWLESTLVCVRLHTTSEIVSVLDGHSPTDFATMAIHDAERYTLRHADRLLWSGGDVLETYRRFYGPDALAEAVRIPDAFLAQEPEPSPERSEDGEGPLQLLYLGRAERRKGPQNLLRAMTLIGRTDVHLTLLGGDTQSGPLQTSLRAQLELMSAGDPRIEFVDHVAPERVARYIREAHAVVVPSLWECWPNVAREALMHNRPILATPVGGLCEMVVPGRSGWLTRDTTPQALADAIERLADDRACIAALTAAGGPRERYLELTDAHALRAGYEALARRPVGRPARPRGAAPLVSVVIPYFRLEATLGETLASALGQTHDNLEVIIVNDGSLREQDAFLYEIDAEPRVSVITQVNAGLSAARNTGARLARGRYVLPLDADDLIDPTFVARCVDVLERDESLAYVTTWVRYLEPDGTPIPGENGGYVPYGNWSRLLDRNNVAGTCAALFRRRVFELGFGYSPDLTSYEDWLHYLELQRAGHYGAVIPERLFHYRVRPQSMMRTDGRPRTELIMGEIAAHLRESEVRWTSSGR